MTYMIADPDSDFGNALQKLLDEDKSMTFRGHFSTLSAAQVCIRGAPPDLAFIRQGKAALNAFRLAGELRALNPGSKIIFVGSQKENAVEAFEYGADGFLLIPFGRTAIDRLLHQKIE